MPTGLSVIVKMQEPNVRFPLRDTPPTDAKVNGTEVAPAAGLSNVRVVAEVVPSKGTAAGNEIVFAALRVAIAAGRVAVSIANFTGAVTTAVVAGASSPPPQAAKAATATNEKANLAELVRLLKKLFMVKVPYKKTGEENAVTLPQATF